MTVVQGTRGKNSSQVVDSGGEGSRGRRGVGKVNGTGRFEVNEPTGRVVGTRSGEGGRGVDRNGRRPSGHGQEQIWWIRWQTLVSGVLETRTLAVGARERKAWENFVEGQWRSGSSLRLLTAGMVGIVPTHARSGRLELNDGRRHGNYLDEVVSIDSGSWEG